MILLQELLISKIFYDIGFLLAGAILGSILTLVGNGMQNLRKNKQYKKDYSKYEGIYLAFSKYDTSEENAFRYLKLTRDKNCFNIEQGISMRGHEDFNGRITMSQVIHNYGNGYYQHKKDSENVIRFGFLEVQLTPDNNLLVHETIYNEEGQQNSDGYRWVQQDSNKEKEIYTVSRMKQQELSTSK